MPIKKEEFYKGAAIYRLIQGGGDVSIRSEPPLIVLNGAKRLWLKYSTAIRSPWAFTFTAEERARLREEARTAEVVIGLVCASDGIVALPFGRLAEITDAAAETVRVSCARSRRGRYGVRGPDGACRAKIPAGDWGRLAKEG